MDSAFLIDEEVTYELTVRGLNIPSTIGGKRRALRARLREERDGDVAPPITALPETDIGNEILVCSKKIEDLFAVFDKKLPKYNDPVFLQIKACRIHVINRLKRLKTENDNQSELIESLLLDCDEIKDSIDTIDRLVTGKPQEEIVPEVLDSSILTESERQNSLKFSFLKTPESLVNDGASTSRNVKSTNNPTSTVPTFPSQRGTTPKEINDLSFTQRLNRLNLDEPNNVQNDRGIERRSSNNFRNNTFKKISMTHWNIKFSGDGTGLSLNDFLSQLRMWARSQEVLEAELMSSIFLLLNGPALTWYRAYQFRFNTFQELVRGLRSQFLPPDYDHFLKLEIMNRYQGSDENFGIYLSAMEMLFQDLSKELTEVEKLDIIRRNMLPYYAEKLALIQIINLAQLTHYCQEIDRVKFLTEKRKESMSQSSKTLLEPAFSYLRTRKVANRVNEIVEETNVENLIDNDVCAMNQESRNFNYGSSNIKCYNCDKTGHFWNNCPQPHRDRCYKCGEKDTRTFKCIKCNPHLQNVRNGSEN